MNFVFRIQVCLNWVNIEFTTKYQLNYLFSFIFALISKHFYHLTLYFTGIKILFEKKFQKKIKKNQENIYFEKYWIWTWISVKIQLFWIFNWSLKFLSWMVLYLVHFQSFCKILGQTVIMPRNESKNKIEKVIQLIFSL